jgi:hypothetical protein
VGIFVEDHGPGILDRHVEHDETPVLATLKQSGELNRLAIAQRGKLTAFLGVAEGHDLQRDGHVHVQFGQKNAKDSAHLLEAHGGFASALFAASVTTEK